MYFYSRVVNKICCTAKQRTV